MSYSYLFKFIIIGDIGVGKSCLLTQFIENKFNPKYDMTVGIEFVSRTITINDMVIKLQIWDTSGQENFKSITRSYYHSIAGVILVYDMTNRESFLNILKWHNDVKENGNDDVTYILIGNKNDLVLERNIFFEEGKGVADLNDFLFLETSAKTGDNVEEAFLRTSYEIYKKISLCSKEFPGVKFGNLKGSFVENKESFCLSENFQEKQQLYKEKSCCDL